MKTVFSLVAGLCLLAWAGPVQAQHDYYVKPHQRTRVQPSELPAWRNNPMYSTHNYKHPNKAAAARRWERGRGLTVRPPTPAQTDLANYKRPMPNQPPVGGITVNHTPSTNLASRNYKIQVPVSAPESPTDKVAKKQKRQDDTTAIGD